MEQNAIYHVMAHAVAEGHCSKYTYVNSADCGAAGGHWTVNEYWNRTVLEPDCDLSNLDLSREQGQICDCDGKTYDPCGVCGGSAITDSTSGKAVLHEGACDCSGHILDKFGVCGGYDDDVCRVPGGTGIAPGKCDCDGNVQDCTGEVSFCSTDRSLLLLH